MSNLFSCSTTLSFNDNSFDDNYFNDYSFNNELLNKNYDLLYKNGDFSIKKYDNFLSEEEFDEEFDKEAGGKSYRNFIDTNKHQNLEKRIKNRQVCSFVF